MPQIALVGLGVMGAALALNFASRGHDVHGYDPSEAGRDRLRERAGREREAVTVHGDLAAMMGALDTPRAVLLMVPDRFVDDALQDLAPHLGPGDVVLDGGNTDFNDTRRREAEHAERGVLFVGMGVSGGEAGARTGPSMMVGGAPEAWARVGPLLTSAAAVYEGDPCADRLGPRGAGHFVKTVHNGIEYADMQMIADVYGILRDGGGRAAADIAPLFARWNEGPLKSYLVEITAAILAAEDRHGGAAVDAILGSAGQKGTGRWTLIEALKLGQSASAIEAAVAARSWSTAVEARAAGQDRIGLPERDCDVPAEADLEAALLTAKIVAYDQGLSLLTHASAHFDWELDVARCAEVWRAGCIIRSAMLDDIAGAVRAGLPHGMLVLSDAFLPRVRAGLPALRRTVCAASAAGIAVPALSGALQYLDTMRRAVGTANLIQAQRDYFGRHGFARLDGRDEPHGPWWSEAHPAGTGEPE